ncbi:amidohydrolase family protein [Microbacteriaceae bacterium VKM Ac-2854]|nr:amidohydrolase family protein [Microbacteriaceae bacterium VKM Ac-2854]
MRNTLFTVPRTSPKQTDGILYTKLLLRNEGNLVYESPTLRNARLADGRLVDVALDGASIAAVTPAAAAASGADDLDLAGALLLPALVNGHAHLDKTFVGAPWQPHRAGDTVPARVAAERAIRSTVATSVAERAEALALEMVRFGTGTVRSHVDIDTELGLSSLDTLLELRERMQDSLAMQIVAFPQSGILASPGVAALLEEAVLRGADVIGGLDPHGFDRDAVAHLDIVFDLAAKHGVAVDIHLHDLGSAAVRQFDLIADRTRALGLSGRVVVSHAYGLGSIALDEAKRIGGMLAHAGISVMTNGPAGPMPPVLAMRAEGATVFSGSDNIRDAWWPYGNGDMLDVARTVAYQSNFRTDTELEVALDLVTAAAATAIGLDRYGIHPGARADLLVLDGSAAAQAVASPPERRTVFHAGRIVSTTRVTTEQPTNPILTSL